MRLTNAQVANPAALAVILNEFREDLVAVRAAIPIITAQLDSDTGVTSTDYASGDDPNALTILAESANQTGISKDPVYT